jgi:tetrahydromethanopterin S-methyltransferase subunit G
MEQRFVALEGRVEHHDARFDQVDARLDRMEARFDQVDARLDRVDARFDRMDARFDQVEGRLGAIEADLGDLKGRSIEDRVRSDPRRYVPSRISRRVRVVAPDEVEEILGRLDLDEADGLSRADALIRATLPDGTEVVFVVEASWNAHGDDIERAVQRAALARRAGLEAAPMVISQRVPHDSVLGRARELGVVVVAEPTGLLVPGR